MKNDTLNKINSIVSEKPLVSVILTSYNHAKYIGKTIESVLAQTYENIELLISDNASTDGSQDIIRSYSDKRIKTNFFNENYGAVANGQTCVSMASGKYFAILCSDDFWDSSKIEKQVEILENNPDIGAVFTHVYAVNENSEIEQESFFYGHFNKPNMTRGQYVRWFFEMGSFLCLPSVLIRRDLYVSIINTMRFFNYAGDFYCWVNLIKSDLIYIIQERLTYYRWHGGNTSNPQDPKARLLHINEMEFIYDEFFDGLPLSLFYEAFSDVLIKKRELSKEELMCEQIILLLRHRSHYCKSVAKRKIFSQRNNEAFFKVLSETYGYTLDDFYAMEIKTFDCEVSDDILLARLFDRTKDFILNPAHTTAVFVDNDDLASKYLNYLSDKNPQCFERIRCLIFAGKNIDSFSGSLEFERKIPIVDLEKSVKFFKANLLIVASYNSQCFKNEYSFMKVVHLFKKYEALAIADIH